MAKKNSRALTDLYKSDWCCGPFNIKQECTSISRNCNRSHSSNESAQLANASWLTKRYFHKIKRKSNRTSLKVMITETSQK